MTKVKPKTKEQVIYFLLSNISLGTYDKKFLSNLQTLHLISKKPLTTNQATLLDKVVTRYRKQIGKLEIDIAEMLELPWTTQPIQSLPEYTETFLSLVEDKLILRSPYKKEFLSDFNKSHLSGVWNRTERFWSIPASTYTLKQVKQQLEKHYDKINYCETISRLLAKVETYKNGKYWDPTYVYVNGNYMIAGINESLYNATMHIPLEAELHTLAHLRRFAVTIDSSVEDEFLTKFDADKISFAIDNVVTVEVNDESIIEKILSIKADLVILSEFPSRASSYFKTIEDKLKGSVECINRITDGKVKTEVEIKEAIQRSKLTILISSGRYTKERLTCMASKVITVVNSTPILIK